MQTFFPSRQNAEDDDELDYVILGELTWHVCIGVNPAGDAGDASPPIFWLVGTSMGMSPPSGVA